MQHQHFHCPSSPRATVFIVAIAFILNGCATTFPMMPTPALYTGKNAKPLFDDASTDSRRPSIDLLFVTDRAPAEQADDVPYAAERSRSIAFGSATIDFGKDLSWEELVRESTATQRMRPVQLELGPITEHGRFPPTPFEVEIAPDGVRRVPAVVEAYEQAKDQLQAEIASRLARATRKEVVLYVHGYHNTFEQAALTTGELCHFLGREFVCALFTWPAGGRRGIFGYAFDRESSEYAVEDLLKTIRIIGRTPGVERIHLIAHSRGTDTLTSAVAALSVEAYAMQSSPDREFHIGNVVLVAPDLDGDVAVNKIFKVFSDPDLPFGGAAAPRAVIPPASGLRVTLYVSLEDKALATASWLMGSIARLGRIDSTMLDADQIAEIASLGAVDIVQVRGRTDFFGHSYLSSNPLVSADIIALLRYDLRPGEPGRPLEHVSGSFWQVAKH
ncbi:MAG TPA: alpha/beta hydrolase [Steroidobacteraceae bacterium]|nr:alpha/beta hydrolase [Steroidobacteraceae bacterium]